MAWIIFFSAKNKKKAVAESDESDDEDSKSVVSNVSSNGAPQPKSKKAKGILTLHTITVHCRYINTDTFFCLFNVYCK